ncbi:hypothetical protein NA57DRAFT_9610, partial [Rhizodiscina lignyota]
LTLIVAATTARGIGKHGNLPWRLSAEMKYFARVTTRTPSGSPANTKNAVIMGRKTWESIPPKFRPLKGRINVVLSRSEDVLLTSSLKNALLLLSKIGISGTQHSPSSSHEQKLNRAYVIGGSSVYNEALKLSQTRHVLLTKVYKDFDCDTFFPIDLEGETGKSDGWRRQTKKELEVFTGEDFGQSVERQSQGDVEFEFCLFSK